MKRLRTKQPYRFIIIQILDLLYKFQTKNSLDQAGARRSQDYFTSSRTHAKSDGTGHRTRLLAARLLFRVQLGQTARLILRSSNYCRQAPPLDCNYYFEVLVTSLVQALPTQSRKQETLNSSLGCQLVLVLGSSSSSSSRLVLVAIGNNNSNSEQNRNEDCHAGVHTQTINQGQFFTQSLSLDQVIGGFFLILREYQSRYYYIHTTTN